MLSIIIYCKSSCNKFSQSYYMISKMSIFWCNLRQISDQINLKAGCPQWPSPPWVDWSVSWLNNNNDNNDNNKKNNDNNKKI